MHNPARTLLDAVPSPPQGLTDIEHPSLQNARRFVEWIDSSVHRLNETAGFDVATSRLVWRVVLQSAFQACVFTSRGHQEQARIWLVHEWIDHSLIFEPAWQDLAGWRSDLVQSLLAPSATRIKPREEDAELSDLFNTAVAERLSMDATDWQGRQAIRELMARLGLSNENLSAMFGVPSATIADWEAGRKRIPRARLSRILSAASALHRMLGVFRPERLPEVIRRKAELFGGDSALDWILRGRIDEVANRYDAAFAYQA